ncbi:Protein disulfide-isomerase LQY1, chloroplastic [Gracilariopsis chorda]|uniref:Protein disulfide-isomerase LQY1, chloroplastic n=1 Tax=Gracilariopsis chorda TaxID=448386 RepID=A0A2V3IXM0_9FLOR|nr:Protein disulfide-isomerase LQY1, chloroplastic [Gracilariopsis chorda]|eukprot:PXF46861.1 Protein disulfide-isomerase LQY1, chloroplastic [Gracilariopsis chorda]
MIEQSTIAIIATMLAGMGGGIALVAWTESQGKRTELRENTQPCAECQGETTTVCNVCNGSKQDPLDDSKSCTYCDGKGRIKCFNCAGSGIQPRFLDRLSPDDFMD